MTHHPSTYLSSLYSDEDYWHPIPELGHSTDSILTITFVTSTHIYHIKPNFDPIFHANESRQIEGLQKHFYINSDPRAKPFACVDTTKLCSPDDKACWSMVFSLPQGITSAPEY